jgi:2-hydroxy-3-keto-5-methylthiopentenyl-1-phosphate phosphatase
VKLDPGFEDFAKTCGKEGVELLVNSDGFDYAVRYVLDKHGLGGLDVYSNELVELGRTHYLKFPNGHLECWDDISKDTQGTCKCRLASKAVSEHRGAILIGNDRTDRCAARYAAKVFVKRNPKQEYLVERCHILRASGVLGPQTTIFDHFNEITSHIAALITAYGKDSQYAKEVLPRMRLETWMKKNS